MDQFGSRLVTAWRDLALGLDDGRSAAIRAGSPPPGQGMPPPRCLEVRMALVGFVAAGWLVAVAAGLATVVIGPVGWFSSPASVAMLVLSVTWLGLGGVAALPVLDQLVWRRYEKHRPAGPTTHPGVPR